VYYLFSYAFLEADRAASLPLNVIVNYSDNTSESGVFSIPDTTVVNSPFVLTAGSANGFSLAATGILNADRVQNALAPTGLTPGGGFDDVIKLTVAGAPSAAVPEPGPWALLLTGLGVIVAVRARTAFHRRKTS